MKTPYYLLYCCIIAVILAGSVSAADNVYTYENTYNDLVGSVDGTPSGTPAFNTTSPLNGTYSLSIPAGDRVLYNNWGDFAGANTPFSMSFRYYIPDITGNTYFFISDATGATFDTYFYNDDGDLRLKLSEDTQHCIDTAIIESSLFTNGQYGVLTLAQINNGEYSVYHNSTIIFNSTTDAAGLGALATCQSRNFTNQNTITPGIGYTTSASQFKIDDLYIFSEYIGEGTINNLYYPTTPGGDNATLQATNSYTGSSITTFNATINSNTYSTTNGTIVLPILTNSTSLYDITYQAPNYFSITYNNINLSTQHSASMRQASVSFNATNRVSGAPVNTFSVNTSSNGGSATDTGLNPFLYVAEGNNYQFEFSKNGWYKAYLTGINITAQSTTTQTFNVYDHKLNVTITSGGSAGNQNFTANIYSNDYTYAEVASTTNGEIIFNITQGNYTIWINDSIHSLESANITLNNTENFTNINIDVRTTHTFNITFYNETTNEYLDNINITWEIISASEVRNGTTDNGTIYEELLTPDSYTIRYWIDEDVPRNYYVTLEPQSSETIRLYIVDEDISSWYIAIVEDASSAKCANQTVSLLRYYLDINGYRTVDMARTDTNGQGVLRVIPNYQPYKLAFTGNCGDFTSEPSQLIDTSNTYTVTNAQSVLTSTYLDTPTSLIYDNTTRTFSYTWTDNTNTVTAGCLQIIRLAQGTRTTEDNSCQSGSTGSKNYVISASNANNSIYIATGYLQTSTEYSEPVTDTVEINFFDNLTLQNGAPFIATLLIAALMLAFGWNAITLLILSIVGLGIATWMALTAISWTTFVSFAILILIIIYRMRR